MKKTCVVLGLLFLSAATAFAAPEPADPTFLASLGAGGACPSPTPAADKDRGGITVKSSCTASCGGGSSVGCSGTGTCVAVDRNCPGERGYVHCSGQAVKYCPVCGNCQEGTSRWQDGGCCLGGYQKYWVQECINGGWVTVDSFCDSGTCIRDRLSRPSDPRTLEE